MPIIGGRSAGVRGLGFQGAGRPGTPSISAISRVSDTEVDITWSAQSNGAPITALIITSSPSISLSYSGTSSTIRVTGTFASDTNYTFTVAAVNAVGASAASTASSSVKPNPPWVLASTFNSSGNYTVSNNVVEYAVYTIGGGNGGGSTALSSGGNGGSGAGVRINNPSLGTNYSVTVGGTGGASSFGTLLNSDGTGNANGRVSGNGAGNGGAGGGNFPFRNTVFRGITGTAPNADCGSAAGNGNAGGNIVLANVATVQYGGGGGGGNGDRSNFRDPCATGYCGGWSVAGGGGVGGAGGGGRGGSGSGQNLYVNPDNSGCESGGSLGAVGANAGDIGGGGGGQGNVTGTSAGSTGRVIVYTRSA